MTIEELINLLSKHDKNKIVAIKDADTDWYLHITEVEEAESDLNKIVTLYGHYNNEVD